MSAESKGSKRDVLRARVRSSMISSIVYTPAIMLVSIAGSLVVARVLGPSSYAVIAAIAAASTTVTAFADLGLSRSGVKIVNDLHARWGRVTALRTHRALSLLLLTLFVVGALVLAGIDLLGGPSLRRNLPVHNWFFVLVSARVLLTGLGLMHSQVAAASLQSTLIFRVTFYQQLATPLLTVAAALFTRDPRWVVAASFLPDIMYVWLLASQARLDLGEEGEGQALTLLSVWRGYARFVALTYSKFLFVRFVVGLPFLLWVLAVAHAAAPTMGNAALAMGVAVQIWTIADIPLAQIQTPLLSRLFAAGDDVRFRRAHVAMTAVVLLSSSAAAIGVAALGPPILGLMYGTQYSEGVEWGVKAALLAVVVNVFSLGNRALHQRNCFAPQVVALLVSTGAIAVAVGFSIAILPADELPVVALLILIGGRGLFWLITDWWADARVLDRTATVIKLRGLAALALALSVVQVFSGFGWPGRLVGCAAGLGLFATVLRLSGGIGPDARTTLLSMAGPRLAWLGRAL